MLNNTKNLKYNNKKSNKSPKYFPDKLNLIIIILTLKNLDK